MIAAARPEKSLKQHLKALINCGSNKNKKMND